MKRESTTSQGDAHASKICASCGRRFQRRKRWRTAWDAVRYCSAACRRRGIRTVDRRLEAVILELLAGRSGNASICPGEAARRVASGPEWKRLMEPARRAARRLVADGRAVMTQRGRKIDPSEARGPVRIRLR